MFAFGGLDVVVELVLSRVKLEQLFALGEPPTSTYRLVVGKSGGGLATGSAGPKSKHASGDLFEGRNGLLLRLVYCLRFLGSRH